MNSAHKKIATPEARLFLAAIVESSDDAIVSKDMNSIITSWNKGAERIFGYREEDIVGESVLTIIPPDLHFEEPDIIRRLRLGERIDHYETERLRKDGTRIPVSLTISPIRDDSGAVIGASKIARDISQLKLAQQAFIESEKLAAAGRIAATIAHEINNPLAAVINLAFLLQHHESLDDTARSYATILLRELSRISDVTRKTLTFYRDRTEAANVDVSDLIEGIITLHAAQFKKRGVEVVRRMESDAIVFGFALELRQVLVNLLLNSLDAMPGPGEIYVSVRSFEDKVRVAVSDRGIGIPRELRHRIFAPFFTTKPANGTGLGLWISKSIIQKHKGTISMRSSTSERFRGTLFVVDLPRNAKLEKPNPTGQASHDLTQWPLLL
jgi:PAS domain S-box-containing protein